MVRICFINPTRLPKTVVFNLARHLSKKNFYGVILQPIEFISYKKASIKETVNNFEIINFPCFFIPRINYTIPYFPKQLNLTENTFPYTFFGLSPGTTKKDIRSCLQRWNEGDNGILDYSQAYRIQAGTGWFVPACILHAPGSLLTYEVQAPSDVFAMFQSMIYDKNLDI